MRSTVRDVQKKEIFQSYYEQADLRLKKIEKWWSKIEGVNSTPHISHIWTNSESIP